MSFKQFFCLASLALLLALSLGVNAMNHEKIRITLTPELLKDNTGLVYIGYPVDKQVIGHYLAQLEAHVGQKKYKRLRHNQAARDHDSFHITLINPFEHPDVKSINMKDIPPIRFEFVGVGQAKNEKSETFFIVANSTKAQQVRASYQLKNKDFHVTLGFDKTDVFGVSKGVDALIK